MIKILSTIITSSFFCSMAMESEYPSVGNSTAITKNMRIYISGESSSEDSSSSSDEDFSERVPLTRNRINLPETNDCGKDCLLSPFVCCNIL